MTTLKNYYSMLQVNPTSTASEIKQAYRRLAKIFHPDSQTQSADHDRIIQINAAYEVLSDPQKRQSYDRQLGLEVNPYSNGFEPSISKKQQQKATEADAELNGWINKVYKPINRSINQILKPLKSEVNKLSADPFDDELMEAFQAYIELCRNALNKAQQLFRSQKNPSPVAGVAAHIYYTLNHLDDGLNELETFTLNYDDSSLHTGQEFFRIASRLRREAQEEMKKIC
ncbi:Chaperone protein DnaJ [Planktothrix tepida]|uniref:Heat shock protein DnaJ-like protein n=2 Tax=Planktothrix TaxID=54304 RepID=A0A1J1LRK2_9CYAN|nr:MULTISPECIES: J domain-containing protein [Planktothrix]CAD5941985.1 Chaperone protein DnaJ [Planktothrix pseudagardhii]CAD5968885.1 Chaperone protein DnaJ [Planktothrix tepida]CUR35224.1 Heat shock protein DnaJ-like protein [Planktothrix tepida PCC 9214]